MEYKPDWDRAKERLLAFWNHDALDRCCLAVHAPRRDAKLPPFPDLQSGAWLGGMETIDDNDEAAIAQWWSDPELNHQRMIAWFENTFFGGEALPVTYINWGAMSMAGMFGSPVIFKKTSVWYPAVIKDWDSWEWRFDPATNATWQMLLAIHQKMLDDAPGRYLVGKPELGNGADVLSLMRGMDHLATDLIEYPEAVKQGVEVISDTWVQLMEEAYQRSKEVNEGDVLAWMGLWAPGRIDQIACDFSSVISPAMFHEFFVPEIEKMGNWCDYGTYHLDGPACMKRMLDTLLEIPQIRTIQFTPGAGSPRTSHAAYIPRYQRILESGRNLYLLCDPDEVEPLLAALPPEGLFMRTYVTTQDEAETLLDKATHWSARTNHTVVPALPDTQQ
jgi:hypothetical protein